MSRVYQRATRALAVVGAALLMCADVHAATPTRTTPIVVRVDHGGFRLADAAIGATAGAGAVLTIAGCLALLRLRRGEPHPPQKGDLS